MGAMVVLRARQERQRARNGRETRWGEVRGRGGGGTETRAGGGRGRRGCARGCVWSLVRSEGVHGAGVRGTAVSDEVLETGWWAVVARERGGAGGWAVCGQLWVHCSW